MQLPFFNRFARKRSGVHYDMEDITDKTLREFLRNPVDLPVCADDADNLLLQHTAEQISQSICTDDRLVRIIMDEMVRSLKHFSRTAWLLSEEEDISQVAQEAEVIVTYAETLQEIAGRQKSDEG